MTFKAVAFDLDGTLVKEKSSWYTVHRYFGTYDKSVQNMRLYEQGKINYEEFMKRDIRLWIPKPTKNKIESILLNYTLSKNAKMVIGTLQQKKYEIFIVTTAPDIIATAVATELKIKHVAANGFVFDANGVITQETVFNVDLLKKEIAFQKILAENNLRCTECIAVGDSKYDIGFLRNAGLGIAYNPDDTLRKEEIPIIADMSELLKFT
jgi:HAD superfamily PSPase-like hydrolase